MALRSVRSRHKFSSGNSWWKPIVLISRRYPFGVNGANLLIPVLWPNRSRVHAGFHWRNWRKLRPKPRKSFFGLIDDVRYRTSVYVLSRTLGSAGWQRALPDNRARALGLRAFPCLMGY